MIRSILCLFLLCYGSDFPLFAQGTADAYPVSLIADARNGEIRLRWAPRDLASWELGNATGYRLTRTDPDNGTETLLADDLRPLPLAAWQPLVDSVPYALLYPAALYGESMQDATLTDGSVASQQDQAIMEENRFGLALLAADQFWEVSLSAGLGYADRRVEPGKTYVYQLELKGYQPDKAGAPKSISRRVVAGRSSQLPQPEPPTADWSVGAVRIAFDQDPTKYDYTTYAVEKAIGDGPFFRVNSAPLIYFEREENPDTRIYFQDSLRDETSEHHYRIIGRTPFGIDGPASKMVSGRSRVPPFPYVLRMNKLQTTPTPEKPALLLEWSVPVEAVGRITGFQLYRSRGGLNDPLEKLHERPLPADRRTFTDPAPANGYFYFVALLDEQGREVTGYPELLLMLDNDPPQSPTDLAGSIDSAGIVQLEWAANRDPDHAAYRVYRSNQRDGHFFQLTSHAISVERYLDTVNMSTLTDSVYYALKAVDFAGNYSALSDVLALSRPDRLPPAAARIIEVEGTKNGVLLRWSASPSPDVVGYSLERRRANSDTAVFRLIHQLTSAPFEYLDTTTTKGESYVYRVVVSDRAGWSSVGPVVTGYHLDDGERKGIKDFTVQQNGNTMAAALEFSCRGATQPVTFQILRSKNGGPLVTLRTLLIDDPALVQTADQSYLYLDDQLRSGDHLSYRLLARFPDGSFTPLTEAKALTIER